MSRIPPPGICTLGMQTANKLSECPQFLANPDQRRPPKADKAPSLSKSCLRLDHLGLYGHHSHYSQDIANAAITTRG
jgi:hypothetical protein